MEFIVTFQTDSTDNIKRAISIEDKPIGTNLLRDLDLFSRDIVASVQNCYVKGVNMDVIVPVDLDVAEFIPWFDDSCTVDVQVPPASLNKFCSIKLNHSNHELEWYIDKKAILNWWTNKHCPSRIEEDE